MKQYESRSEAVAHCPKAVAFIKVEGGYLCFESIDDYRAWSFAVEERGDSPTPTT